jgi:hypothetical protein
MTAQELREQQRAEYGTYVAVTAIDIEGVRAFNEGDAVPVSHVSGGVVRADQVAKVTTKAGREAAGITTDTSKG